MSKLLWRASRTDISETGSTATRSPKSHKTQKWDESGVGRDESGKSRDESADGWDESAARAAGYPSRLNDFAT
jgi:hypothetical protein